MHQIHLGESGECSFVSKLSVQAKAALENELLTVPNDIRQNKSVLRGIVQMYSIMRQMKITQKNIESKDFKMMQDRKMSHLILRY